MIGPGQYDDIATQAREAADAEGVVLIVFGGKQGAGFSVQALPHVLFGLPDILESVARQIREDLLKGQL